MQKTWVRSLGQEDPLEKEMATHSSILARRIPWTKGLEGYSPWGLKRVGHNIVTEQQQQIQGKRMVFSTDKAVKKYDWIAVWKKQTLPLLYFIQKNN